MTLLPYSVRFLLMITYQNVPQNIDPIAFSLGPIHIQWYALMWLTAFIVVYVLLVWRIKKGEGDGYDKDFVQDLLFYGFLGALIGGRLGYVLFYDLSYYLTNPLLIISPYDFGRGVWTGIYGMSYHGGVIGAIIAFVLFSRKRAVALLPLVDFVVPAVSLGYFFGRLGNFLNNELFGRVTTSSLGMYFDSTEFLRHPSQLYEAFFEGIILFIALWMMRNRSQFPGQLAAFYICGYAIIRFCVEFTRAPDAHLGLFDGILSMGQILSMGMFVAGAIFYVWAKKKVDKA